MSAIARPAATAIDLHSPETAAAALRTFWRLAEQWRLSAAEQMTLLGVGRSALYQWKQGKVGPLHPHHVHDEKWAVRRAMLLQHLDDLALGSFSDAHAVQPE